MEVDRWVNRLLKFRAATDLLSAYGTFYLISELINYYIPSIINSFNFIFNFYIVSLLSIIYALYRNKPKNYFEYKLKNRDTVIALKIGNAFDNKGALIVPINDEFDVHLNGNVMRSNSIKCQLIRNYYDSKIDHLRSDIQNTLRRNLYKNRKNGNKYKMGTVVEINQKNKKFLFVANSRKNGNDRVYTDKESLEQTLSEMWYFISEELGKENIITVPILGTGMGRLNMTREQVIQEIILSFIASCTDKCFCDKLTISVHPSDIINHKINIELINDFLRAKCLYAQFEDGHSAKSGKPVE